MESTELNDTRIQLEQVEALLNTSTKTEHDLKHIEEHAQHYGWIFRAIRPSADLFPQVFSDGASETRKNPNAKLFIEVSELGLRVISLLDAMIPFNGVQEGVQITASIAIFTDQSDPWTTKNNFQEAIALLSRHEAYGQAHVRDILQKIIKPIFAQTTNPNVTALGRRVRHPLQKGPGYTDFKEETKPWKHQNAWIIPVIRWAIKTLKDGVDEDTWPLIVPPVLNMVDDSTPRFKAIGCELLSAFLQKTPYALLKRTGLGEVIFDAIMPSLLCLPSLTPREESVYLLERAYPALTILGNLMHQEATDWLERREFFDRVLRDGVLKGLQYAGDDVKIAELLVRQIASLTHEMGIWSVKHLKVLIPLLADTLSAPFGNTYPLLLISAAGALQSVFLNGWPRAYYHRGEAMRGILVCWTLLDGIDIGKQERLILEKALSDAFKVVRASVPKHIDFMSELRLSCKAVKHLDSLFSSVPV